MPQYLFELMSGWLSVRYQSECVPHILKCIIQNDSPGLHEFVSNAMCIYGDATLTLATHVVSCYGAILMHITGSTSSAHVQQLGQCTIPWLCVAVNISNIEMMML